MNKRDIGIIVLVNIIIAFGFGAIRKWGSELASLLALGGLGLFIAVYLIYYYTKKK